MNTNNDIGDDDKDYEVGYRKPPKHAQWKKGQSGNPKGRPKGSKNMSTILNDMLSERVTVRENGKVRTMPLREAWAASLVRTAMTGSVRDQLALMKALHQFTPTVFDPQPDYPTSIQVTLVESDGNGGRKEREIEFGKEPKTDGEESAEGMQDDSDSKR